MNVEGVRNWSAKRGLFAGHHFFRTSGSSGEEKWVALSEEALEWSARSVVEALEITSEDVLGLALPEVHVGGFGMGVRARISGARLARFEEKWDAGNFSRWCEVEGVTVLSLVPTQVHDLVAAGCGGGKSLRVIVVGGGALENELSGQAKALGWPVVPSYGMTETCSQVATGEGLPLLPGWEAKMVEGCLALKGGGLLTALIRREAEGFSAIDPMVDGWFLTQDRVELGSRGLRVLGRADRLVKVLGELVDLESLEKFWRTELGGDVALVARPDERRGSGLYLFFEGGDERITSINATLPGPARLMGWEIVARLPRSPLGKLDRVTLMKFRVE
jgi:O-succinylbenzoic acid--CoA ligase